MSLLLISWMTLYFGLSPVSSHVTLLCLGLRSFRAKSWSDRCSDLSRAVEDCVCSPSVVACGPQTQRSDDLLKSAQSRAETLNNHYSIISTDPDYTAPRRKLSAKLAEDKYFSEWQVFRVLDRLRPTAIHWPRRSSSMVHQAWRSSLL